MESYEGVCIGGPYNGQMMAQPRRVFVMVRSIPTPVTTAEPRVIQIGEYRHSDFGVWHWWATKEGDAAEVLYGPAVTSRVSK